MEPVRTLNVVPPTNDALTLTLTVTDAAVVAELNSHADPRARDAFALAALKVGVLALKAASGHVGAGEIRAAGEKLLGDVQNLLESRASSMTKDLATSLAQYFDPAKGLFPQRVQALVSKGGELERLLESQFGGDDSTLAKALTRHVGEQSPLFKMLSPTDANGLRAQLQSGIERALAEQRTQVLKEFSLDSKDSALSRLVQEVTTQTASLEKNLEAQVAVAVAEFSLDKPDSALSRLVSKVETAQKAMSAEFSTDNDSSALSRMSKLLQNTRDDIGKKLTLDDKSSPLSLLRAELLGTVDGLVKRSDAFHTEVKETLARLESKKAEALRSTQHGLTFEARLGELLARLANEAADAHEDVGTTDGVLKRKIGDFVTTLGEESGAPGGRIAWEAKENKAYTVKKAREEMAETRKNRQAQLGVFVWSKSVAPEGTPPFLRLGSDLFVVWDADDPATDVYVRAAYGCAKALCVRERHHEAQSSEALLEVEKVATDLESTIKHLDELAAAGGTAQKTAERVLTATGKLREIVERDVAKLQAALSGFKRAES